MKRLSLLLLAMIIVAVSSFAQRVIGYYAGWEQAYTSVQYDKLTDVNYAFAEPKTNNTVGFSDSYQLGLFQTFINYVKNQQTLNKNIRVNISIGGASDVLASRFKTIGSSTSGAKAFAKSCVDFCLQYGLDGIDIDWEPVVASDANAFTNIMKELRNEINARASHLQLSAAVFPEGFQGTNGVPNAGVTSASFSYVDYFSLMVYDYGKPDFENHSPADRADDAVNYWVNTKGLNKSKIVLGLPFYGRSAYWAYNRNDQIKYSQLVAQYGGAAAAGADKQGNWRYNGQATIKNKTTYAINEGLKGVMIWEISQDVSGTYSLLKAINDAINAAGCPKPDLGAAQNICGKTSVTLASGLDATTTSFVWKKNNQIISGANGATYTATSGGVYEVEATKKGTSCTKTSIVSVIAEIPAVDIGNDIPLCGSQTVEVDATSEVPGLNYTWKKGTTIVSTTAKVQINSPGTYSVTVSDPKNQCATVSASVTASTAALSMQGDNVCKGNEAHLKVLSSGGPYSWFDAQTGGNFVHLGNDYKFSPSATTTLWVQNTGGSINAVIGQPYSSGNAGNWEKGERGTGDQYYLIFDAFQDMRIDSVTIWYGGAEDAKDVITFTVTDKNGNVVGTGTGTTNGHKKQRLAVGIDVPAGTGYKLSAGDKANIWIDKNPWGENLDYPFVNNFMQITHCEAKSEGSLVIKNWYVGFWDWKVSTGETCDRVPVTATVKNCTPPTVTVTASKNPANIGEKVVVTAKGTDNDGQIAGMTITQDGSVIQTGVSNDGNGTYTVELSFSVKGDYNVCAKPIDNDNLSGTEKCVTISIQDPLGITNSFDDQISLYPNPFANIANVSVRNFDNVTVNVYNMSGILVESISTNDAATIGANLEKGIYLVEFVTKNNSTTRKLIKE